MDKPNLAVDGIVLIDEDLVLVERNKNPKGWALPGGMVEEDETLTEACVREVKEETGLDVEIKETPGPTDEFAIYDDPGRDPRSRVVSTVFICRVSGGNLEAGSDAGNVDVFTVEEAMDLDLAFDHKQILGDFMNSY